MDDVCELLAERAHRKGLELACFIDDRVCTELRGDAGRLRQILLNLVSNAVKFTERGEVVLGVTTLGQSDADTLLRFEVRDTGIGIVREVKDRIFDAFTQADGSMTRRYGGTGLGLAIARQLVEMMGGAHRSRERSRSRLDFLVHRASPQATEQLRPAPARRWDLQDLRVLIVDDNTTNREILQHQVRSWGMKDVSAEDGFQALKIMRSAESEGTQVDIAILDMMMPGMDGLELAQSIKHDPALSHVRLVLLTSVGLRGDAAEARRCGVDAYLGKPARQSELYDCLATVMGRTGAGQPLVTKYTLAGSRPELGTRILLAEDNPVNREVASSLLESLGYQHVVSACDGREVIEALERATYDIILMDCQMPIMDGFEATAEIRRREQVRPEGHRIAIIALTANAMAGDRERCLAAGMDDYLPKPLRREELKAALERHSVQPSVPAQGLEPRAEAPAPSGPVQEPGGAAAPPNPSPWPPGEAPLDPKTLDGLRELQRKGAPSLLAKLIRLYLQSAPALIEELRSSIERRDPEALRNAAHSLKSSSANIGALRLSALCKEVERLGRDKTIGDADERLATIRTEFERVEQALERERGEARA